MSAPRGLPLVVTLVLVAGGCVAGCGGGTTIRRSTKAETNAGPADIPAMRALLARFSPGGSRIVTRYEALPTTFVFKTGAGSTTTVTHRYSGGFADYFDDGAPENLVDYMSTAVHEVYHAYSTLMGYQLLVDTGTPKGLGAEAVEVDGAPLLVSYSATVPAREMDASFPADARTARYRTYVSPSQETQSTQTEGVFGLLDELVAYYHSARTRIDFWPWVRDEAPASEQLLVTYIARFHEMWSPYAEFQLFILHYLRHVRERHPAVYRGLVDNQGFRRAFITAIDGYAALLATAAELEPTIHAFARSRGLDAGLAGGQLTFDGSPFRIRDEAYPAVVRHLASEPYRTILAELR